MSKMSNTKKTCITAMLIAVGIILPIAFHTIPQAGMILLPMHIPVLLAGLIAGPIAGLAAGLVTPGLSGLLTGLPMPAMVPGMTIELAVYGFAAGMMMRLVHTKIASLDLYISLIAALAAGRLIAGAVQALFLFDGAFTMNIWLTTYFVTAMPGLILQLLFVPSIVMALERERVIPMRYSLAEKITAV